MNFNQILSWLPWLTVILGLFLLIRGLHGKQVSDHPHCAKCGFDLFGKPEDTTLCSECGIDVGRRGAIRIGQWQRNLNLIFAGSILIIPSLLFLCWLAYVAVSGGAYARYTPLWWLKADLNGSRQTHSSAELSRRIAAKEISGPALQSLIAEGLDAQARPYRVACRPDQPRLAIQYNAPQCDMEWSNILAAAYYAGQLTIEQCDRYASQSMVPLVQIRPRVSLGRAIPMSLGFIRRHYGVQLDLSYRVRVRIDGVAVEIHPSSPAVSGTDWFVDGSLNWSIPAGDPVVQTLRPGPHSARVELLCDISDPNRRSRIALKEHVLDVPFDVVDGPTATLRNDPSLKQAVDQWIEPPDLTRSDARDPRKPRSSELGCLFGVWGFKTRPDVDFCWDVTLRSGNREWKLPGSIWSWRGQSGLHGFSRTIVDDFDADTLDVILRPNPDAAEQTVGTFDIWSDEIILRNVPVKK